jgi:hypothetical protein
MGMQLGRAVLASTVCFELDDDVKAENAAESLDETDDFETRQEMTSCGALSSA